MDFIENQYYHLYNRTNNEEVMYSAIRSTQIIYIHSDYLGSVETLTDQNGNFLESYAFDPWGKMRNPSNWNLPFDENNCQWFEYICYRGFTGHEHMPEFGLINMKARLYDPVVGQFLSPDNNLTYPDYSQNYNKYSYALNNPMKFVDPSGEDPITAIFVLATIYNTYTGIQNVINTYETYGSSRGDKALGNFAFFFALNIITSGAMQGLGIDPNGVEGLIWNIGSNLTTTILDHTMNNGTLRGMHLADFSGVAVTAGMWGLNQAFGAGLNEETTGGAKNGIAVNEQNNTRTVQQDNLTGPGIPFLTEDDIPYEVLNQHWQDARNKIAEVAESYVSSDLWLFDVAKDDFPAGTYKCNKFVYDVLEEAGLKAPMGDYGYWSERLPLLAGDWGNPNLSIDGWAVMPSVVVPQPGDVAAVVYTGGGDYSGHVGIVVSGNRTVSSSTSQMPYGRIRISNWGFRKGQEITFRRYFGIKFP